MLSRSALAEILPVQRVISLVAEVGQLVHVPLAGLRPRIVIHYLAESGVPEDRRYVVHDGAQQGGRQEDNARRAAAGLPPRTRRRRRKPLTSLAAAPP
jgi:hypothetical protein